MRPFAYMVLPKNASIIKEICFPVYFVNGVKTHKTVQFLVDMKNDFAHEKTQFAFAGCYYDFCV